MKCPRCGKPAYVGYTEVKCTNTKCVHFDQREADDFAARKTLPPKGVKCVSCHTTAPLHKAGCPYLVGPKVAGPGSVKITIGGKTLTSAAPARLSGYTSAPWGTPQGGRAYFSTGLAGVAKGSVLDTWGTILSAPRRPGEADDQYRARLASLVL